MIALSQEAFDQLAAENTELKKKLYAHEHNLSPALMGQAAENIKLRQDNLALAAYGERLRVVLTKHDNCAYCELGLNEDESKLLSTPPSDALKPCVELLQCVAKEDEYSSFRLAAKALLQQHGFKP